jgi:hypothetical protein
VVPRLTALVLAAAVVGLGFQVIKGDGTDALRYVLGNLAAPWLVVPFVGGRAVRSPARGALLGAVLAVVSLVAFYAALEVRTHSLSVHVAANYVLFGTAGAVAGAVVGCIASLSRPPTHWWLVLCLPALFVLEPVAAFAVGSSGGRTPTNTVAWAAELVLGVIGAALVVRRRRRSARQ